MTDKKQAEVVDLAAERKVRRPNWTPRVWTPPADPKLLNLTAGGQRQ
jgi:hypothetical protein